MGDKLNIYFGHPITYYDTPKQTKLIKSIEDFFPDSHVENPGQPHHGEGYKRWTKITKGMDYFFKEVLPAMDAGVFLPFEDRMLGKGVYTEAKFLFDEGKKIFEISHNGLIEKLTLNPERELSVDETRKRVYPDRYK